jgi:uncharacterized protein (DUF2336 family)
MQNNATRFSRLVDLAQETSSEKRRELLREVTDAFLESASNCTEIERSHFGDIMSTVSTGMEVAVRRHLAQQLAKQPNAPRALVQQLANDEFGIAKDILQYSPVLEEADLIAIAQSKHQDKLGVIAIRPTISEELSEAIVEHGDDQTVSRLVANDGAKVSRNTFQRIVDRSETSTTLQAPLSSRQDLPADMLNEMFTFVSGDLRTKISERLSQIPPEVLEKALQDASRDVKTEMRQLKDADRKAMVYVAEMQQQKKLNEALLLQLTRGKQATQLIHAFAKLAEVEVKTVRRLFTSRNIEGIAIICRSVRFERATFAALSMYLETADGGTNKSVNEVLDLYSKVTQESAQRVMRFWRIRKEVADGSANRPFHAPNA